MPRAADRRARVAAHYDELSEHYAALWGEHIHHGYYERGDESREEATRALLALLFAELPLDAGATVLDVGCGIGGTSRLLARDHGCRVTGVTLSAVQARLAADRGGHGPPRFLVADAASLPLLPSFDALFAVEVLSHVTDRTAFFAEAARLLRPGGRLGIAAWLASEGPHDQSQVDVLRSIEEGMLVSLPTRAEYERLADGAGFDLVWYRDVSDRVARTWDLCLEIVRQPAVWSLALAKGGEALAFVRSFRAMQRGFACGAFRYALLAAERRA
jgi:tocopherol O-methyltransferase